MDALVDEMDERGLSPGVRMCAQPASSPRVASPDALLPVTGST